MYCATYCKGRSEAVDCKDLSGDKKEQCIKSCLDCRSPNKDYCFCPEIFPPKSGQGRALGLQGRSFREMSRQGGDPDTATGFNELVSEKTRQSEDDDDTVFFVSLSVAIIFLVVGVCIFCVIRYNKRKKANAEAQRKVAKTEQRSSEIKQTMGYQQDSRGKRPAPPSRSQRDDDDEASEA